MHHQNGNFISTEHRLHILAVLGQQHVESLHSLCLVLPTILDGGDMVKVARIQEGDNNIVPLGAILHLAHAAEVAGCQSVAPEPLPFLIVSLATCVFFNSL